MKIVIAGGQSKADFLIEMFKKEHHKLVVINDSLSYGTYLAKKHKVDVIINDPTSKFVLEEAQIENFDVLVAKSVFSVKKTVASVSDPRNVQYFRMMGVDTAISATYMISKYIEKASVLEGIARSIVTEFEALAITTITIEKNSIMADKSLAVINLPSGISIGAVMRENDVIVPRGSTVLYPGDKVLVISSSKQQQDAIDLFAQTK